MSESNGTITGLTMDDDIETWVYQTIGAASVAWENACLVGFDEAKCRQLGDELLARIKKHEHIWGKWFPYSRTHKFRTCLDHRCLHQEIVKADA